MSITIPPEALEKAARGLCLAQGYDWDRHPDFHRAWTAEATAAIRAALAAWPGMGPIRTDQPIGDWCDKLPAIILPLTENTDEVA